MEEWDGEFATMPKTQRRIGRLVPDLSRISEDRWEEVLLPLGQQDRSDAAYNFALGSRLHAAIALYESLPPGFSTPAARRTIAEGMRIPAPQAVNGPPRAQVNFRLPARQHARLAEAAELLGQKPTQLARMLVVNGVNRIFADQARLAVGRTDDEDRRGG